MEQLILSGFPLFKVYLMRTGLSYVFESQFLISRSSIKLAIKQRLCDQFIQKLFSDLDNSAREFYKVVKKKFNLKSTLLDYQNKTEYT